MAPAQEIGPWEDLSEELHREIEQAFARLPNGCATNKNEALETVRSAGIAWLTRKNDETGHEHMFIHEVTSNDGNGTVIAGTNHHPRGVQPDSETWAYMKNPNFQCEIWHNHPDRDNDLGPAWPSAADLSALGAAGTRVIAVVNGADERTAIRIRSHKNLTAGKLYTWLLLVDATARKIMKKHQGEGSAEGIEVAEAVTWAGADAGLYTVVLEPSSLRRGDIVEEILAHPDIANAPPAQQQKETPYAGPNRTTQQNMGPAANRPQADGPGW